MPVAGAKKRIVLVLGDDPILLAFADVAATAYPELPLVHTLREAILVFMQTDPLHAATVAARRAALADARRRIYNRLNAALGEALRELGENS